MVESNKGPEIGSLDGHNLLILVNISSFGLSLVFSDQFSHGKITWEEQISYLHFCALNYICSSLLRRPLSKC